VRERERRGGEGARRGRERTVPGFLPKRRPHLFFIYVTYAREREREREKERERERMRDRERQREDTCAEGTAVL